MTYSPIGKRAIYVEKYVFNIFFGKRNEKDILVSNMPCLLSNIVTDKTFSAFTVWRFL